jgi:hypothetical protein
MTSEAGSSIPEPFDDEVAADAPGAVANDDVTVREAMQRVADLMAGEWDAVRNGAGEHLFLFTSSGPAAPAARAGFRRLEDALVAEYGTATVPVGFEDAQMRAWSVGGRDISVQLFDRTDSTVMLSVEDHELAAAAERAALARADQERGRIRH